MSKMPPLHICVLILISFILAGCQTQMGGPANLDLTPISYQDLPGWKNDQMLKALPALKRSCSCLLSHDPSTPMLTRRCGGGLAADWRPFCKEISSNPPTTETAMRQLLEQYLRPYQASGSDGCTGLFTGYDEPLLRGSLRRHGRYQTPLYRLPGSKVRYKGMPRNRIVKGGLKGRGLELVWVDDPIDAFFLQIQGSGRIQLDNGRIMRLGYAGTNGCGYYAIGKTLIDRGEISCENISRQSIRAWLKAHPKQAESIMSLNKSYVFFRVRHGEGPIGSHGVPLTPQRSLAVDREYISLGTPLWIDLSHPDTGAPRIQSLVVAQDTGGAIKGGVRGDLFWGCGASAADYAGRMKSRGEYYLLLPK
ncbi:MAG: murein transglycosylase [Alphaproteobacteria bacterium]|nr:murein transglycosylase [Alphaproteobacteria bacterium]